MNTFTAVASKENYEARIPLVREDVVVFSDPHVRRHDPKMLARAVKVGKREGITTLVIVGDLFDNSQTSRHRKSKPLDANEELGSLKAGLRVLEGLATQFRRIVIPKGNHDDRYQQLIEAAWERKSSPEHVLDTLRGKDKRATFKDEYRSLLDKALELYAPSLTDKVEWLDGPSVFIKGPKGCKPYLATHPAIYSKNPPQAEKLIWQRFGCPIIGAHGHGFGLAMSPTGEHPLFQIGCMTDYRKHEYLFEKVTGHPKWVKAFATIKKGVVRLYVDNPYLTDWSSLDEAA